jgi:hypothetical protein
MHENELVWLQHKGAPNPAFISNGHDKPRAADIVLSMAYSDYGWIGHSTHRDTAAFSFMQIGPKRFNREYGDAPDEYERGGDCTRLTKEDARACQSVVKVLARPWNGFPV